MRLLRQLAVIFGVCLAGEAMAGASPIAFPGSVMSMVIMFLALAVGAIRLEWVREAADFLTANMAFLFVPLGVAIREDYGLLQNHLGKIIAICAVTTVIVFWVSARAAGAALKWQNRRRIGAPDAG